MSEFRREGDKYSFELKIDESHILINLVEQLLELLGEGDFLHHYSSDDPFAQLMAMPTEISQPEDPVLRRLLPNAYADPEAADDFRRYTEPALRKSKQDSLRRVREELGVLVDVEATGTIDSIEPSIWLKVLNDLRLALSVRLSIEADAYEKFETMPEEDPQKAIFAVYFWLGALQENLLALITR